MTTTTTVLCPQAICVSCAGDVVEATFGTDNGTTVTVQPCESLKAQGWEGPQAVLWHNQAIATLVPAIGAVIRHRDGLVTFNG